VDARVYFGFLSECDVLLNEGHCRHTIRHANLEPLYVPGHRERNITCPLYVPYSIRKTEVAGRGPNLAREGENQGGYWIGNLLYCPAGLNVTNSMNAAQNY
jgi:hypothetical protein